MDVSVKDLLDFEALPDEVRAICEKQIEYRQIESDESYEKGFEAGRSEGYSDGKQIGYESGYADGKRDGLADKAARAPLPDAKDLKANPPTQKSGGA